MVVFLVAFAPKLQTRQQEEELGEPERNAITTPAWLEPPAVDMEEGEGETASFGWETAASVQQGQAWSSGTDEGRDTYSRVGASSADEYMHTGGMGLYIYPSTAVLSAAEEEISILDIYWGMTRQSTGQPARMEPLSSQPYAYGLGGTIPLDWDISSLVGNELALDDEEDTLGMGGTLRFDWYSYGDASASVGAFGEGMSTEVYDGTLPNGGWYEGYDGEAWDMGPSGRLYNTLLDMLELLLPADRHMASPENVPGPQASPGPPGQEEGLATSDTAGSEFTWNGGVGYYEYLLHLLRASMERNGDSTANTSGNEGGRLSEVYGQLLDELAEDAEVRNTI